MDIYDFLIACSQSDEIEFSVFDCNSERVWKFESAAELQCSKFADYEVMSFDVWYDKVDEIIKMEINIELNPWIDICITVPGYQNFADVEDVATKAYDEWFNIDTDECIGDYIENKLKEKNFAFEMYIGYDKVCESEEVK